MSCVSYVASFSGLSFYITPSVFSNMYLSCVLCILCCQFLWIVLTLPLRYSLTCICPVSCVTPSVFSNMYLSCVLCMLPVSLDCPFTLPLVFVLCLVYPMLPVSLDCPFTLPLRYSLTCICPVSCVSYVASFSGLSCVSYVASFSLDVFFSLHLRYVCICPFSVCIL